MLMYESNRRRILAGTCAALLSALLLFSAAVAFLDDGTLSHGAIAATGFLAVLYVALTIGAVFGITQLVRRSADGLGLFGAALTLLGATVGARITVLRQLALLGDASADAPRDAIASLLEAAPIVWVSIVPIGLMYPIGLITLGIALFVARPVSRWAAAFLVVGGVLFPLGRTLDILPAIYACDAVVAIFYAYLSREILTRRELWDDTLVTSPAASRRELEPVAATAVGVTPASSRLLG
jgi:hypothetical protein